MQQQQQAMLEQQTVAGMAQGAAPNLAKAAVEEG